MSSSSAAKENGIVTMQTMAAIQVTQYRRIQTIMYLFPAKVANRDAEGFYPRIASSVIDADTLEQTPP